MSDVATIIPREPPPPPPHEDTVSPTDEVQAYVELRLRDGTALFVPRTDQGVPIPRD